MSLQDDIDALVGIALRHDNEAGYMIGRALRYLRKLKEELGDATQEGNKSGNDQPEHPRDDQGGASTGSGSGSSAEYSAPKASEALETLRKIGH